MPRLRLLIGYDGAGFSGWAAQPGLRTVEGVLAGALGAVLREPVHLTVAGRTDAGVHARAQVAHFDCSDEAFARLPGRSADPAPACLLRKVNGLLARGSGPARSSDVLVRAADVAPASFDARFSATWRRYCYRIADATAGFDPLTRGHVLWVREPLEAGAMARAGAALIGEWDFAALCKPRAGATTIRRLTALTVTRTPAHLEVGLAADAFCHSMVRSIVGCLIEVGRGRKEPGWLGQVLASRDRALAASVAPAHGLTLEEVGYPDAAGYGAQQARTRRVRTRAAGRDQV